MSQDTTSPVNGASPRKTYDPAEFQRDKLYDLLADQGREHSDLLRDVGSKIDKLADACNGMSGEIKALQVTPSLVRLIVIALVLGLAGLGVVVGRGVAVDLGWVHVGTESASPATAPASTPVVPAP